MLKLIELRKKYLPALLLAFLAPAMFAACSSDSEEAPPPPPEESGSAPPPEDNLCDEVEGEAKQECLDELENEF